MRASEYGTDLEYLFLQRIKPGDPARRGGAVALTTTGWITAPTFATTAIGSPISPRLNGALVLLGQPAPKSRQFYIKQNWLARHMRLARATAFAYVEI